MVGENMTWDGQSITSVGDSMIRAGQTVTRVGEIVKCARMNEKP